MIGGLDVGWDDEFGLGIFANLRIVILQMLAEIGNGLKGFAYVGPANRLQLKNPPNGLLSISRLSRHDRNGA